LFDGTLESFARWRGTGMTFVSGEMVAVADDRMHLFYYPEPLADFTLHLELRIFDEGRHNSGVFVRFADPALPLPPALAARAAAEPSYDDANPAWRPVITGFEIQIDDTAAGDPHKDFYGVRPEPDGMYKNRTGAIYKIPAGDRIWHGDGHDATTQDYAPGPGLVPGRWFNLDIDVRGDDYTVWLDGQQTTSFHNSDPDRGRSPGLVGVQSYPYHRIAWRDIRVR
jgi:hypothetical protein